MLKKGNYIVIDDTEAIFSKIDNCKQLDPVFIEACSNYLSKLKLLLNKAFDKKVNINVFSRSEVERVLQSRMTNELEKDKNTICICLDRFLLNNLENTKIYKRRFFRFHICRLFNDTKIPRLGSKPFLKQLETLQQLISNLKNKQIIIVDDGIFSGGTIKSFLQLLSTKGIKTKIKKVIIFVGNHKHLKNFVSFPIEIINSFNDLHDWINTRDFSPLGGKILAVNKNGHSSLAIPYLYPWSAGNNANLEMSPHFFSASKDIIREFQKLAKIYEISHNKQLTFKKFVENNFPLPTDFKKNIAVSTNDSIVKYLDNCVKLIQKEQNRHVVIFDMDGVLYQLDGNNNGYSGSTLEKAVLINAKNFIKRREGCINDQANIVLTNGLKDTVGLSAYLSRRYGISRLEYFNSVWNINPSRVINDSIDITIIISALKQNSQLKLILLTSAPQIWTQRVLKYLKLSNFFESIYTGEQFDQKKRIFKMLVKRYKPKNIISVGNQFDSDIKPAQKLGMDALFIKTPSDLRRFSSKLI